MAPGHSDSGARRHLLSRQQSGRVGHCVMEEEGHKGEKGTVKKPYIHYAPVRVSLSLGTGAGTPLDAVQW